MVLIMSKYNFYMFFLFPALGDLKKEKMSDAALKSFETTWKKGSEVFGSCEPFDAALHVFGKSFLGTTFSKISATQCSGLIGLIVTSISPEVYYY